MNSWNSDYVAVALDYLIAFYNYLLVCVGSDVTRIFRLGGLSLEHGQWLRQRIEVRGKVSETQPWSRTCMGYKVRPSGRGYCKRRRREAAIAEGKKPFTTRGSGEHRKLPQRGLGQSPRNRRDFEHFIPERSTFWALVNLIFLNNQIKKIVPKPSRFLKNVWL